MEERHAAELKALRHEFYEQLQDVRQCSGCISPSPPPPTPSPYTLMNNALSWSDASAACLAAGLQLASVQSASENALLVTAAAGNSRVWIGGTDAASEGTWVWSPSGTPLSYTNWNSGEPNNWGNEDCLEFNWKSPGLGKWNDVPCNLERKYVCESRA